MTVSHVLNPKVLEEVIRSSGVPFRENAVSYIFACPKCQRKDKLYLRKHDGRFVCWRCKETEGYQGRPEYALTDLTGRPLRELRKVLYGDEENHASKYIEVKLIDFFGDGDDVDEEADELVPVTWPFDFYPMDHKFAKRGVDYVAGRGLSLEMALKFGLRYCPPQQRVFFPISIGGFLYGWQGRAVGDTEYVDPETGTAYSIPKAITLKGFRRDLTLMGQDNLVGSKSACLFEGPFDWAKGHLCPGSVASLGKAVSRRQIALIRNSGVDNVYLALDRDAAAETRRLIREFFDLKCWDMRVPRTEEDHGAMTPEGVLDLFHRATPLSGANAIIYVDLSAEEIDRRRLLNERRERSFRARRT